MTTHTQTEEKGQAGFATKAEAILARFDSDVAAMKAQLQDGLSDLAREKRHAAEAADAAKHSADAALEQGLKDA